MHLQNCRCFQEHLRMLLQSLRALCFAPGGPGSIWNYLGAPVRTTGLSGRFACGFRTDLHFADDFQSLAQQTLALVAAAIYCALSEYATGKKATVMFSQDEYRGKFCPSPVIHFTPEATALINHTFVVCFKPPSLPLSPTPAQGTTLLG